MRVSLRAATVLAVASVLLAASCEDSDAASIRLTVAEDLSGDVTVCRLVVPDGPGPFESAAPAVAWAAHASVVCSRGHFDALDGLDLAGIRFAPGRSDGVAHLQVTLERGPDARWPRLLSVADAATRTQALTALDPEGASGQVGRAVKLHLELPVEVLSAGVRPEAPGVASTLDDSTAELTIPVGTALEEGPPLVWTLTWTD